MNAGSLELNARAEAIFTRELDQQRARTTRMFAWLMLAQWIGGIVAALAISPFTWIGAQQRVHEHVWIAVLVGGALAGLPIALALTMPERRITRHVIAAAQMLFSALLIHLTGGRLETHFHVFGSLAFMAFYRDIGVLATATAVVGLDHMIRGIFVPLSVFGVDTSSNWRWLEHAGWVVFEDIILVFSCVRGLKELRGMAQQQAALEAAKSVTEREVLERTKELRDANTMLEQNQAELSSTNAKLVASAAEREALHRQLLAASREAGMAEVATGVLHNVGNVLNSINVGVTMLGQKMRQSELPDLIRAAGMMGEHQHDLARFLTTDERGKLVPAFVIEASRCVAAEHEAWDRELASIARGVDHIKHVISLQQGHAKRAHCAEAASPTELVETALQMQMSGSSSAALTLERRLNATTPMRMDRHQILQILVNLISNARKAVAGTGRGHIVVETSEELHAGSRRVRFAVTDNGAGIRSEDLNRIFNHGFTTRNDGHGFGLHTAATAAQAMGGSLSVQSDGLGHGARFELIVPESASPATNPSGTSGNGTPSDATPPASPASTEPLSTVGALAS